MQWDCFGSQSFADFLLIYDPYPGYMRVHIGELGTVRAAKRTDILVYLLGIHLELLHSYQQVITP